VGQQPVHKAYILHRGLRSRELQNSSTAHGRETLILPRVGLAIHRYQGAFALHRDIVKGAVVLDMNIARRNFNSQKGHSQGSLRTPQGHSKESFSTPQSNKEFSSVKTLESIQVENSKNQEYLYKYINNV
jgi:hypothetical protein